MQALWIVCGLLCVAAAHPAVGIVADSSGAIYYSDTVHVWRIDPTGSKTIAVPNVHTHQLWIDPQGNLYGEHLAYHDPALPGGVQWTHRVWKRSPAGQITHVIPDRPGFLTDYKDFSFQRDARGAMYWCTANGVVQRRARPGAPLEAVASLGRQNLGWMSVLADGTVFVSDHGSILRVSPGGRITRFGSATSGQHAIMAAWSSPIGVLYAAYDAGAVKQLDPARPAIASTPPWRPVGGLTTPNGTTWILEASPSNEQRVRRVDAPHPPPPPPPR